MYIKRFCVHPRLEFLNEFTESIENTSLANARLDITFWEKQNSKSFAGRVDMDGVAK